MRIFPKASLIRISWLGGIGSASIVPDEQEEGMAAVWHAVFGVKIHELPLPPSGSGNKSAGTLHLHQERSILLNLEYISPLTESRDLTLLVGNLPRPVGDQE